MEKIVVVEHIDANAHKFIVCVKPSLSNILYAKKSNSAYGIYRQPC